MARSQSSVTRCVSCCSTRRTPVHRALVASHRALDGDRHLLRQRPLHVLHLPSQHERLQDLMQPAPAIWVRESALVDLHRKRKQGCIPTGRRARQIIRVRKWRQGTPIDNNNALLVVNQLLLATCPWAPRLGERVAKPLCELRLVVKQLGEQQIEQAPQLAQLVLHAAASDE